jgi:hypothetical protein
VKKEQNVLIMPRIGQYYSNVVPSSKAMVSPGLLYQIRNKEAILEETQIGVLGLSTFDLRRLREAGIITLRQLADCNTTDILNIPHFGIKKVRRLKANFESFLTSIIDKPILGIDQPSGMPLERTTDLFKSDQKPILSPDSELEAFSESLEKLKKQLGSLELKIAKAIKNK